MWNETNELVEMKLVVGVADKRSCLKSREIIFELGRGFAYPEPSHVISPSIKRRPSLGTDKG
jgi:hypothetical protein